MPEHEQTSPDTPQQPAGQPENAAGEQQAETAPLGGGSGNRWEPAADDVPPATPVPPVGPPVPPTDSAGQPWPPPAAVPPASGGRRRTAWLAGIAAAALLLVGVGGFAAGHASAGDHHRGDFADQSGVHGTFPGGPGLPPGGPGDGDDDGFGGHEE